MQFNFYKRMVRLFDDMKGPVCTREDGKCPRKVYVSDVGVVHTDAKSLMQCCQFEKQVEALNKIKDNIIESKQANESRNKIRRGIKIPG